MNVVQGSRRTFSLIGLAIVFGSCNSGGYAVDIGDTDLPATVDLNVGEAIHLSDTDVTIRFDGTVNDNRSMLDDGSVAGNARISLRLHRFSGPSASWILNTTDEPRGSEWEGYRIVLVALNPVPQNGTVISSGAYVATIEISPLGLL